MKKAGLKKVGVNRRLTTPEALRALMPPLASTVLNKLIVREGWDEDEAMAECERVRGEWRTWEAEHGERYRAHHRILSPGDYRRIRSRASSRGVNRGVILAELMSGDSPPDPPVWDEAA